MPLFSPYQAYIALKSLSLLGRLCDDQPGRARNGLGTGFAAFAAADQGQRLVRMMGLLPASCRSGSSNLHE